MDTSAATHVPDTEIEYRIAVSESYNDGYYKFGTNSSDYKYNIYLDGDSRTAVAGYEKDFILGALGQRSDNNGSGETNWCEPEFLVSNIDS